MSTIIMEKKNTKESEKFEFRYKYKTEENKKESYDIIKEVERKYGMIKKGETKK